MHKAIFILTLLVSLNIQAQERSRELYIATNSLTSLNQSLEYKSQFGPNRYLRLTLGDFRYDWTSNQPVMSNNFPTSSLQSALRMTLGLENRRALSEHVTFYKGFNVLINPGISSSKTANPAVPIALRRQTIIDIGVGCSAHFGIMTEIKERFVLGINYEPQFGVGFSENDFAMRYNAFANLGPSQLRILLGLKWNKKEKA